MSTEKSNILSFFRALEAKVLPAESTLILHARNGVRNNSDWDLLNLFDDWQIQSDTFGTYAYPFVELGCEFSPKNTHMQNGLSEKVHHYTIMSIEKG